MDETYNHPSLGTMFSEDTDRIVRASVPFAVRPIEVCLAGEDEGSTPSSDSLAGYNWISAHWPRVLEPIEDQAFGFYEPYRDAVASVPKFDSPRAMWGTEVLSSVRVWSKDDFEVSLRFAWQEEDDPHVITFYVEGGRCLSHSVDGQEKRMLTRGPTERGCTPPEIREVHRDLSLAASACLTSIVGQDR